MVKHRHRVPRKRDLKNKPIQSQNREDKSNATIEDFTKIQSETQEEKKVEIQPEMPQVPMCLYENRELSWLKFNKRVLEEAQNAKVPLCERMSFLSIFQSNLDEFFMVRVGSLHDQKLLAPEERENKTNMTPQQQMDAIFKKVTQLSALKDATYEQIMSEVLKQGIQLVSFRDISNKEEKHLEKYFMEDIVPLLSAMVVGRKQPFPFLKGQEIYALAMLGTKNDKQKLGIIPCSSGMFPRLIPIPNRTGVYILSEELILHFLPKAYKGYQVLEKSLIRVTRNADIDVDKVYDEELNYRDKMAQLVKLRKKLAPVRLELTRDISASMLQKVCQYVELQTSQIFYNKAPLELSFLFEIEDMLRNREDLVFKKRVPQQSAMIKGDQPIIPQVLDHDILLSYPYESIRPFLDMLSEAAEDSKVVAIRMTLYRLAKNSKVVEALAEAAENGKQVDVLVELKARFDEENNIEWSRRLEEAGCHVVYGIDNLKVHSKLCLITRKDGEDIQYITQVGTGNYNEKTSRLYTDLSLITSDKVIGHEAFKVFQAILLGEVVDSTEHLLVAPKCLQDKVLDMIEQEIKLAQQGKEAYIGIKINSLTNKKIIEYLVKASEAGVKVDMVVRGICCLRSGIPGKTDNIRIVSIVGRYLEHSRIYIFGTPEREKMYISSADFMTRNTLRRVEVGVPIRDSHIRERIRSIFRLMLKDNVKGRLQMPDGNYKLKVPEQDEMSLNAQEYLFEEAYKAAGKVVNSEE